jgi:hypothetical protein
VSAIITDVTKTWLELRSALQGALKIVGVCLDIGLLMHRPTGDYEKVGSQYGRIFLWTTLRFYTPFLFASSRRAQTYLENIAGPFDTTKPVPPSKA